VVVLPLELLLQAAANTPSVAARAMALMRALFCMVSPLEWLVGTDGYPMSAI
jgi:hypothetical protein